MNKLYRYPQNGYLGGVCQGFAVYTKTDPIIWRILTVFAGLAILYIVSVSYTHLRAHET